MDLFSLFSLLGGLALFLYGMNVMGTGLEKLAGSKLERILEKLTNNPIKGALLGLIVTVVIQSSSATTVMVVGFVNAGLMTLGQSVGVIMGANIGTTVTAWILSLMGIESNNFFLRLIKPDSFSPILAIIGIFLIMLTKSSKKKFLGEIMVGFAVLIFGMTTMSNSVAPLADVPEFASVLTAFSNPVLGVLAGLVFTAVIQSSSASVGILQALSMTGSITFASTIPILLGQNIGTCVTALISCLGAKKNAKRAALVHFYFNLIVKSFVVIVFYIVNIFVGFKFMEMAVNPVSIAIVHSLLNIFATVICMPFTKKLVWLAKVSVKNDEDDEEDEKVAGFDDRFLNVPSFAIEQSNRMTEKMALLAKKTLINSIAMIENFDLKKADKIRRNEDRIDQYEDKLGSFLVKLSSKELTEKDSNEISKLLHSIGDFERIGDHSVNILEVATEIHDKNIIFSDEAKEELRVLLSAVNEILDTTIDAFIKEDIALASHVEPLEQVIDGLKKEMKLRHIKRLKRGECTIETGFVFSDLLANFERVADHCSNIAVCVIQTMQSSFDTHMYLNEVKNSVDGEFNSEYEEYNKKYALPAK